MAQTNFTPILTYKSDTASAVPSAANLTNSANGAELAVNTADKRLFTKDSGGNVVEIGTNPSSLTLPNGTANGIVYANGSKVLTTGSALTFDGTTFTAPGDIISSGANPLFQGSSATGSAALSNSTAGAYIRVYGASHATRANYTDFINGSSTSTFNSSGNLGLGVTPSAWGSQFKVLQGGGGSNSSYIGLQSNANAAKLGTNHYYNGSNYIYASSAAAARFDINENNFNWNIAPSGTAGNAITFTQAMTLDASGRLAIGTTSPIAFSNQTSVTVNGTSNGRFDIKVGDTHTAAFVGGNSAVEVAAITNVPIVFATNGSERARIDSSGNLLVGTTTAIGKLTVYKAGTSYADSLVLSNDVAYGANQGIAWGSSTNISGRIKGVDDGAYGTNLIFETRTGGPSTSTTERARMDSSGQWMIGCTGQTGDAPNAVGTLTQVNGNTKVRVASNGQAGFQFYSPGGGTAGAVGTIVVNSSSVSYNTSSDYRLKENVKPMTGALAKVAALKPCTYKWKVDGSDGEGFIAHELAEVCPQCVTGEKDAVDEDGKPKYQGIDTSFLVATLTAALQELKAEFDAYKASHP